MHDIFANQTNIYYVIKVTPVDASLTEQRGFASVMYNSGGCYTISKTVENAIMKCSLKEAEELLNSVKRDMDYGMTEGMYNFGIMKVTFTTEYEDV